MIRLSYEGTIWRTQIEAPAHGGPARKVVTGRRHRLTGTVPSRKSPGEREIVWESPNELALVLLESFNPRTTSITAQPHTLHAWTEGREFRHTPDYLLGRAEEQGPAEVVEVKPRNLDSDPVTAKMLLVSEACHRALGFDFSVRTMSVAELQPNLSNCSYLLRYQKTAMRPALAYTITSLFLDSEQPLTIQACVAGIDGRPATRFEIYALACAGLLDLDLTVPLGPRTRIIGTRLPRTHATHRRGG